ncbi:MAG: RNA polymerase sigma factor [Elusimicrobiota bacterium]
MKRNEMIPEEVILDAMKKKEYAIERIYEEFSGFVWNIALRTTGNVTLAEDASAEVFVRIFKNIRKFDFRSSFKTWLYRVAVNTTLNLIDREKRRKTLRLNETYDTEFHGDQETEKDLDNKSIVEELLSGLEEKDRMMIILREVENLSYEEIAESLEMNIGTVKTNIYRARERLREIYNRTGGRKDEMQ